MRLCCCFFLHWDSFASPGLWQLSSEAGRAQEKGCGVDILHGVGLIPMEVGGQVLSGFGDAGASLSLILGWGFVVVIFSVAVFISQEIILFGLGIINKPLY